MSKKSIIISIIILIIVVGAVGYTLLPKFFPYYDNGKSDIIGPLTTDMCREKALSLSTFTTTNNQLPISLRYDLVACGDKATPYLVELLDRKDLSSEFAIMLLSAIATNKSVGAVIEKFSRTEDIRLIDTIGDSFQAIECGTPAQALVNCLTQAPSLDQKCLDTLIRLSDTEVIAELVRKIREIYPSGKMPVPTELVSVIKPYTMTLAILKPSNAVRNNALQENNNHELIRGILEIVKIKTN